MDIDNDLLNWILDSDVSLQYLVHKNLLNSPKSLLHELQKKITLEGYGKAYMDARNLQGKWGQRYYNPKWSCTHYVLMDMKLLAYPRSKEIERIINNILDNEKSPDGGINISTAIRPSDVCVNGMFLNYASYFIGKSDKFDSIIDNIIDMHMNDGGFNCEKVLPGASHSSLHSSICVLEGLLSYIKSGNTYRSDEIKVLQDEALEFILIHHLYKSHKTLKVIHPDMTRFSYPYRYWFDVLRCLEYFVDANIAYDDRMSDAIDLLKSKRLKNGAWKNQGIRKGSTFFDMEKSGSISPINTYRALRVYDFYGVE